MSGKAGDSSLSSTAKRPRWLLWSTRQSIASDIPSITGTIETFIAVPIYWLIATYFETYLWLGISIAIAPLVLLRSPASEALGVDWFLKLDQHINRVLNPHRVFEFRLGKNHYHTNLFWMYDFTFLVVMQTTTIGAAFLFLKFNKIILWQAVLVAISIVNFLNIITLIRTLASLNSGEFKSWNAWKVTLQYLASVNFVAILILLILYSISQIYEYVFYIYGAIIFVYLIVSSVGVPVFVLLMSLLIRFLATTKFIAKGVEQLPRNFRLLMLCTSPIQHPELVPGLENRAQKFSFKSISNRYLKDLHGDWIDLYSQRKLFGVIPLIWFFPAWLYRITLKSTAWFWWPLAFMGADLECAKDAEEFQRTTTGSLWAKMKIVLAVGTIVVFLWANLIRSGTIFETNPLVTVLGYFVIVNWSLPPWQILTIVVAILSVAIVFMVDDASGQYRIGAAKQNVALMARAEWKLGVIERLARFRLVSAITLWLLVGGQTTIYFNSTKCWFTLPMNVERWAAWAYGQNMPVSDCTHGVHHIAQLGENFG